MQQIVIRNSQREFHDEINALLMDGWSIAPGGLYATSFEAAPRMNTPKDFILPSGRMLCPVYMAIVENSNAR